MAMMFEHRTSGYWAGCHVWEGEAGDGVPVTCHISAVPSDEVEAFGGARFVAACDIDSVDGLRGVADDAFATYEECVAYLEGVLARIEEGEFDWLLYEEGYSPRSRSR